MNLPAADFLPHTPPLLWVRTLRSVDDDTVSCESVLDDTFLPFLDNNGALPAYFLMEMIAQTIGVWAGWHDKAQGREPQSGLLLGCRQFACEPSGFPPGTRLRIDAKKLVEDNGTGSFEAHVFCNDNAVAHATLTTHQTSWENLRGLLERK